MTNSRLEKAVERYKNAIEKLTALNQQLTQSQILEVLTARDEVQAALADTTQTSGESLAAITELDKVLKENAFAIASIRKEADWQTSFNPQKEAWWWFIEDPKAVKPWDKYDWFCSSISIFCLAASLGLGGEVATRFLSGSPDIFGWLTVSAQGVAALFANGGALTQVGKERYKRTLGKCKIPEQYWHEISAGISLLFAGASLGLWFSLPKFAIVYSNWGFDNYKSGDWGTAEQQYQRSLRLNPDDAMVHFRLGLLYEELQKFDAARTQYQIAAQDNIPEAINNLSRLYILNKNYLLEKALDPQKQLKLDSPIKHAMLKNLGWARLKQGDYPGSETQLLEAIDLQTSAKLRQNIASTHCLLAQLREAQKDQKAALAEWQICNNYADKFNPDEDGWRITAQKRLAAEEQNK
jgi:tetratricopeptide (TPR) repeat protein